MQYPNFLKSNFTKSKVCCFGVILFFILVHRTSSQEATDTIIDVREDIPGDGKWKFDCSFGYSVNPEDLTCNGISIPLEEFTGTVGFWTQCVSTCAITYNVQPGDTLYSVKLFQNNSKASVVFDDKTEFVDGNGWIEYSTDISDFHRTIILGLENVGENSFSILDVVAVNGPIPTTTTTSTTTTATTPISTTRTTTTPTSTTSTTTATMISTITTPTTPVTIIPTITTPTTPATIIPTITTPTTLATINPTITTPTTPIITPPTTITTSSFPNSPCFNEQCTSRTPSESGFINSVWAPYVFCVAGILFFTLICICCVGFLCVPEDGRKNGADDTQQFFYPSASVAAISVDYPYEPFGYIENYNDYIIQAQNPSYLDHNRAILRETTPYMMFDQMGIPIPTSSLPIGSPDVAVAQVNNGVNKFVRVLPPHPPVVANLRPTNKTGGGKSNMYPQTPDWVSFDA